MSFRINTNTSYLNAYSISNNINNNIHNSLEKLSSGLRINKAADDASGMMIADTLRSQAHTLNQAIKNGNDAINIATIADNAIDEQVKAIETFKVKGIQLMNDSNSNESRKAIINDMNKLLDVVDNIAETTSYNGKNLLNGQYTNKKFQIGDSANTTIDLSIGSTHTSKLGHTAYKEISVDDIYNQTVNLELKNYDGLHDRKIQEFTFDEQQHTSIEDLRDVLNTNLQGTGIRAVISDIENPIIDYLPGPGGVERGEKSEVLTSQATGAFSFVLPKGLSDVSIKLNDFGPGGPDYFQIYTKSGKHLVGFKNGDAEWFGNNPADVINNNSQYFDSSAVYNDSNLISDGTLNYNNMSISMSDQSQQYKTLEIDEVSEDLLVFVNGTGIYEYTADWGPGGEKIKLVKSDSGSSINATITGNNKLNISGDNKNYTRSLKDFEEILLDSSIDQNELLDVADSAIIQLDRVMGNIGSFTNQAVSRINNIATTEVNVKASESQIRDVDFAEESANFQKNSILAQAGNFAMSQANQQAQAIQRLLQ